MHALRLRGARTHNLRSIDLDLEPGTWVALTGPSGAGKSSLALDTLYAEGQRRFVESFSPYARQFLERLERPPLDELDPIAAAVAIDRKAPVKSIRSTLATMADLEPYLAGLFAHESLPHCPEHEVEAIPTAPAEAAKRLATEFSGRRALVCHALEQRGAEEFLELRDELAREGYRRLVVAGAVRTIDDVKPSEVADGGVRVDVVVDRCKLHESESSRLQEAIERAWERGKGLASIRVEREGGDGFDHRSLARGLSCPQCARLFEAPRPGHFSYNHPLGACAECRGFGNKMAVAWDKVIPDPRKSLEQGAIKAWSGASTKLEQRMLVAFCEREGISMKTPWQELSEKQRARIVEGEGSWEKKKFPGIRAWFKWLETKTYKMQVRIFLARYRTYVPCEACGGSRLGETARLYRLEGRDLAAWHRLTVDEAHEALARVTPRDGQGRIVHEELRRRLAYLARVGLGYLTLDRQAKTLSGGEAQRASLTTALGTNLTGALFVLDEPTVGLHATDIPPLADAMQELAASGNAVVVIEHDEGVVRRVDRVVELGPGAGLHGGKLLFDGTPTALATSETPTGRAWRASEDRSADREPRKAKRWLTVRGARAHNLQGIDVRVPLGVVCAITGASGSGKSTLAEDVIARAVARQVGDYSGEVPGAHDGILGTEGIGSVVLVDQSPLGRTARGNAATYTKAWDRFRAHFAATAEAKRRRLQPAAFSFNVKGGRCETCAGEGHETVEMQFLADVSIPCPVCQGKRFRTDVLEVTLRGLRVDEVLAMSAEEALRHFDTPAEPDYVLRRALQPLVRVGLGYLPLGQPLSTLSGGEAQRLKLARGLGHDVKGALFVLDEPSAGLHATDAASVIEAMHALVDEGASVLLVEHDLDLIARCDWVIDLGPGGGPNGGRVVAEGTPASIAKGASKTGLALAERGRGAAVGARAASSRPEPMAPAIVVERAREHSLKNVSCTIPHGTLCVVTGPSGSGKSSLAFDVIFAEGQRRFMETLTPYARQFLPTLPRPEVDRVIGVPPSIALEQRLSRGGANSTVATVTEAAHYLRLLYAKVGDVPCPKCGGPVRPVAPDALFERLRARKQATMTLYAPAVRARKGTYLDVFTNAYRCGVTQARVDAELRPTDPAPKLAKTKEHTIDLVVFSGAPKRLERSWFDLALSLGEGAVRVAPGDVSAAPHAQEELLSTRRACSACGTGVPELDPRWFSFNTKQGQCEDCEGTGLRDGREAWELGTQGIRCASCDGSRLAPLPRGVRLFDTTYATFTGASVGEALARVRAWKFPPEQRAIADAAHRELERRLAFCDRIGLSYLALDRAALSLSGGEMQRLRLAAQLGSGLTGALYVLDEPTIGLHPVDTERLVSNLRALADTGSTVLVVEHDSDTIRAADQLIELGPGGGRNGGHLVAAGPAEEVLALPASLTGRELRETVSVEKPRRAPASAHIVVKGARAHNLKGIDVRVPAERFVVVAGVSGSGKSTFVRRVLYPAVRQALDLVTDEPLAHDRLRMGGNVARAIAVDQSPIGRSPRSVPATFLGVWDDVRKLFAGQPEAKVRGFGPARFSFNAKGGGRCPTCEGQGYVVSEMAFLPDVTTVCEACGGARFEPSTLEVRYQGLSIGDVLRLTVHDAAELFVHHPRIARPLRTLDEFGVGYLALGQPSTTLSGGEAQRLKLATELTAGSAHAPTMYVLDEPTTGLHLADVRTLLGVFQRFVERGDTLVVVEHHLDVVAAADWVIELGPGSGPEGGTLVFEGTPAELVKAKTPTGRALARAVKGDAPAKRKGRG
jgi:excinuclease ABC subunit A